jgi:hypothetical protein
LFLPPAPRSNLELKPDKHDDRDTALAAVDFIWELIWWRQYLHDDPDDGNRLEHRSI